jgi:hypothetical protein
MIRSLTIPPNRTCELCQRPYVGQSDLVGICHDCCCELGGGKYSARAVQTEARAMQSERRTDRRTVKRKFLR